MCIFSAVLSPSASAPVLMGLVPVNSPGIKITASPTAKDPHPVLLSPFKGATAVHHHRYAPSLVATFERLGESRALEPPVDGRVVRQLQRASLAGTLSSSSSMQFLPISPTLGPGSPSATVSRMRAAASPGAGNKLAPLLTSEGPVDNSGNLSSVHVMGTSTGQLKKSSHQIFPDDNAALVQAMAKSSPFEITEDERMASISTVPAPSR
jgi:hypothetical protein